MLMQSFLSAADLGISEEQKEALIKTLVLLETGKLKHVTDYEVISCFTSNAFTGHFNMLSWSADSECGTVRCIGGTAEVIGRVRFSDAYYNNEGLFDLFFPYVLKTDVWHSITNAQAARALRSYLNCGDAKWSEAVSDTPRVPAKVEAITHG